METLTYSPFHRQTNLAEQRLYDYFRERVQHDSPEKLIETFRRLFIQGREDIDYEIYLILKQLVNSEQAQQEFKFILNRCCHILVNYWHMQPQMQAAIPQLVELFEGITLPVGGSYRTANRLRQLIASFTQTDQYLKLQRLARAIGTKENRLVGNLINRYPYLYEHCLLSEDNSIEHLQTVRKVQSQVQHRFELELFQYAAYHGRNKLRRTLALPEQNQQILLPAKNPTLLTDGELNLALYKFVGPIEGNATHKDLSRSFLSYSLQGTSYAAFKKNLYDYLIASVDSSYGKHQFNRNLYKKIQSILPDQNSQRLDELLLLRTTSQLLNFLVVESQYCPDHYIFVDLITNLGATPTVSLLLKVLLLCQKVKPYMERRFSILFSHYESSNREGVPWLVRALENLHIALSVHFGRVDLSTLFKSAG